MTSAYADTSSELDTDEYDTAEDSDNGVESGTATKEVDAPASLFDSTLASTPVVTNETTFATAIAASELILSTSTVLDDHCVSQHLTNSHTTNAG